MHVASGPLTFPGSLNGFHTRACSCQGLPDQPVRNTRVGTYDVPVLTYAGNQDADSVLRCSDRNDGHRISKRVGALGRYGR